jgi:hypothetical protein
MTVLDPVIAVTGVVLVLLVAIYGLVVGVRSRGPMRMQPEPEVGPARPVTPIATCPGTILDASPDTVRGFGGAVYTRRVKLASERLEFYEWGVRLSSASIFPPGNTTRDVRYEDVTELALLAPTEQSWTWPGVRLRTALAGDPIYFVVGERALPQLVAAFAAHGIDIAGQVKPTRMTFSFAYVYPTRSLEEIPKVLRDQIGD